MLGFSYIFDVRFQQMNASKILGLLKRAIFFGTIRGKSINLSNALTDNRLFLNSNF